MCTVFSPVFKQAEERPALRSAQRNHRCPRSNKRHFFHCTIARLAAARTFFTAEISRHALTDLNSIGSQSFPLRNPLSTSFGGQLFVSKDRWPRCTLWNRLSVPLSVKKAPKSSFQGFTLSRVAQGRKVAKKISSI